ncbi:MAG: polysaccharide biosynthesis protein [Clostridia bacterium]|nr:polysaccharide biosynthesis protein [Clostridia bacterium]
MVQYSDIFKDNKRPIFEGESREYYRGKAVLVTGGGGSVGSELVRMLATLAPKTVIVFDMYENNAFELCGELSAEYRDVDFRIEIGSVCDARRLATVFSKYRPSVVFHAAAHKHVSLMEENCAQALRNNSIGTAITADLAEKYGAEKFVLISTDKAVRPTGVMGATKRVCEMLTLPRKSNRTIFCAVRFGNVFGSHASVVPIFEKQILSGKSVTVTDKRMTRYFISLDDAAQLLLCAGAMAKNGELFVLDMGKPVNIYDIAERMIRFFGKEPCKDIEIVETGLRPGEKLFEEYLLSDSEKYTKTANDMIYIEKDKSTLLADHKAIYDLLCRTLENPETETDGNIIKKVLADLIPDYTPKYN